MCTSNKNNNTGNNLFGSTNGPTLINLKPFFM